MATTAATPTFHIHHRRSPMQMQMQFLLAPVSPLDKCMSRKRQRASECSARGNSHLDEEDTAAVAHTKRARTALAHEISGLKASVRQMEHQVAHASASIQELRSLIGLLAVQRQRTAATPATACVA